MGTDLRSAQSRQKLYRTCWIWRWSAPPCRGSNTGPSSPFHSGSIQAIIKTQYRSDYYFSEMVSVCRCVFTCFLEQFMLNWCHNWGKDPDWWSTLFVMVWVAVQTGSRHCHFLVDQEAHHGNSCLIFVQLDEISTHHPSLLYGNGFIRCLHESQVADLNGQQVDALLSVVLNIPRWYSSEAGCSSSVTGNCCRDPVGIITVKFYWERG